jgi:hypothetical protein
MANISIKNPFIERAGRGISMPADADVDVDGGTFRDITNEAILIRDRSIASLGLRPDTPLEHIRALAEALNNGTLEPVEATVAAEAERRGLSQWLADGANATTIGTALVGLYNSGAIPAFAQSLAANFGAPGS